MRIRTLGSESHRCTHGAPRIIVSIVCSRLMETETDIPREIIACIITSERRFHRRRNRGRTVCHGYLKPLQCTSVLDKEITSDLNASRTWCPDLRQVPFLLLFQRDVMDPIRHSLETPSKFSHFRRRGYIFYLVLHQG